MEMVMLSWTLPNFALDIFFIPNCRRNKILNNSETSFEDGCGNNGNRFQTHRSPLNTIGSPNCTNRSPPVAPSSSRLPINGNSSMYYYSDTLRKGKVTDSFLNL